MLTCENGYALVAVNCSYLDVSRLDEHVCDILRLCDEAWLDAKPSSARKYNRMYA